MWYKILFYVTCVNISLIFVLYALIAGIKQIIKQTNKNIPRKSKLINWESDDH